ncbi:TetR family transcriptional regulator [Microbacterium resistens]|uniref:TetR family transcriptional regulator n=1 Tax=Microbacterium resistens TaxID=156977 RepID=A0ABY3RRM4_9MICO|nr:TetR family transcriptional regulator [Microbacterium resistens]UGS25147.1 TetR family transcriptional regulator [Microbacterium resistens]
MSSERRRRELLEAAIRVVSRGDASSLSARAVAEEAGVSPGSVIYHYGDMDSLVSAALVSVIEQYVDLRRQAIMTVTDPVERLRLLIDTGVPEKVDGALRFIYEHIDHARTHPERASLHRAVVERQIDLYEATIDLGVATGVFRPGLAHRRIASTLVALEDGFDLWALIGFQDRVEEHREILRAMASRLLAVTL